MIYILISVCCSVSVAILFKLLKNYAINLIQVVSINYLTASLLSFLFFNPALVQINKDAPWMLYGTLALIMPSLFFLLARSIKSLGIVKTDIAQRLSLFLPIIAAYFLFKEDFNLYKVLGLSIGMLAILLTFIKKTNHHANKTQWYYPILIFLGFGLVDILFKQVAQYKLIPYTTALFLIFCLAFAVSLIIALIQRDKLRKENIIFGIALGTLNFGNILFYLKAHQNLANNPSTVFASMNFGVIILGSLIGVVIFKEKLTKINYIGLFLALVAISLITLSQLYAI